MKVLSLTFYDLTQLNRKTIITTKVLSFLWKITFTIFVYFRFRVTHFTHKPWWKKASALRPPGLLFFKFISQRNWARRRKRRMRHSTVNDRLFDTDSDGVTQHSSHTRPLDLQLTSLILDIYVMVNWHMSKPCQKQGIRWPVSRDHMAESTL